MPDFKPGQSVTIAQDHNHLTASAETIYQVAMNSKIHGQRFVNLLLNGVSVGAIPESKLIFAK